MDRILSLMERARRAFKLPPSEDATTEQRLAEVERMLPELYALVLAIGAFAAPDREVFWSRVEKLLLENEKRRGIVPE